MELPCLDDGADIADGHILHFSDFPKNDCWEDFADSQKFSNDGDKSQDFYQKQSFSVMHNTWKRPLVSHTGNCALHCFVTPSEKNEV